MADTQAETRVVEQNSGWIANISEEPCEVVRDLSSPRDASSDSDNAERTAREKMKKASIAALSEQTQAHLAAHIEHPLSKSVTTESLPSEAESVPRGRLKKKRSFEELLTDDSPTTLENGSAEHPVQKSGHHKRMRSREISSGGHIPGGTKFDNGTASPLEEESDDEAQQSPGGPGVLVDATPRETTSTLPEMPYHVDNTCPSKTKRSRDQIEHDDNTKTIEPEVSEDLQTSLKDDELATAGQPPPSMPHIAKGEPEKKRHRDESLSSTAEQRQAQAKPLTGISTTTIPSTSGLANVSTASPFSNFASPPKDPEAVQQAEAKSTSTSAFASSGLSAFASSEKSPFDTFRSSNAATSSGFGSGASLSGFGSTTSLTSKGGFGNTGATSPFSANRSAGFGNLGGFGSTMTSSGFSGGGFGERLSSFATSSVARGFGGSIGAKQKAFGAPEEEDDEGSEDGESNEDDAEARPKDKRFVEQDRMCLSLHCPILFSVWLHSFAITNRFP
jgi:Ran-binding protein 3